MKQLTPEGYNLINQLAQRYGLSRDAVMELFIAVTNGNGGMAQFNHPDLGGMGQWMSGGMIMVGDMFNHGLKQMIDQLCYEIANIIASRSDLWQAPPPVTHSTFNSTATYNWWPDGLQNPTSTGSQNQMRYAYFAAINRLAIENNGHVTLYDTLNHQIGGFSQQQSGTGSISFTSQYGVVDVNSLPIISIDNQPFSPAQPTVIPEQEQDSDIFATLEKLASLKAKGIISEDEFNRKKAELLARL